MKKSLLAVFVFSCLYTAILAQGNWQSYPYSPPGSVLTFPDDDGYHPDLSTQTEWWYLNLHLTGSAPQFRKYDVMLVYFRFANMRIFNISESYGTFHTNVLQVFPTLTHQEGYWDLTYKYLLQVNDYSRWTYPNDSVPYRYIFHAEEPTNNDRLDVTVTGLRPPLVVGGDGFVPLGDQGDSSFYYSYTNMSVQGTIRYNGVDDIITSGIGWIDRQYGPFMVGVNADNKYEWFSLQMDKPGTVWGTPQSPSEFNIWQIFSDSSDIPYRPEWRLVSSIYPDDTQDTSSSFFFERTGYWHDAVNNKYYSNGWRFIDPDNGVCIDMDPVIDNQVIDVTLFKFWEGGTILKGTVKNQPVDGLGFAELVADFDYQTTPPSVPQNLTVTAFSDHCALSWQAATAGTYPIGGYRVYRSNNNNGYWQYIASVAGLSYDDYSVATDSSYYYSVSAYDNQTATSASGYTTPVFVTMTGIGETPISFFPGMRFRAYPNPFSEAVYFEYMTGKEEYVLVEVYDVAGRTIFSNENKSLPAVLYTGQFGNENGLCTAGIYMLKITTDNQIASRKIIRK